MLYYCCAIVTEAKHGLNLYDMWILHLMISQKPILAIIDVDHKSIYHLKFCRMFIGLGGGDAFFLPLHDTVYILQANSKDVAVNMG